MKTLHSPVLLLHLLSAHYLIYLFLFFFSSVADFARSFVKNVFFVSQGLFSVFPADLLSRHQSVGISQSKVSVSTERARNKATNLLRPQHLKVIISVVALLWDSSSPRFHEGLFTGGQCQV